MASSEDLASAPPEALPSGSPSSKTVSGLRSLSSRFAGIPSHKSCKDLVPESDDYSRLQNAYPMLGHDGRLPLRRKLLWAWPMMSWNALKYMKIGYMKRFFTDDYPQASLGIIAFSSVLSVLVDAFTDPKMAIWTDTFKSKYGRRRPFIFASAFIVPAVFVFHWMPFLAGGSTWGSSLWFGIFHIFYKLCDTLFNIPLEGWGAQLTPLYKEKTTVWVMRDLFVDIGILLGMALAPVAIGVQNCTATPDDGCMELPLLSAFFGLVFMHACLQLAYYGREPASEVLACPSMEQSGCSEKDSGPFSEEDTVPMLISTYLNWPFRVLLFSVVAKAVGQEIPLNVMPYMTAWVIGEKCYDSSELFGYLIVGYILFAMLSILPWMWCASKLGKFCAYIVFNAGLIITMLSLLAISLDTGDCMNSYLALALVCIFGFSWGGSFLLKDMVSDVVDYDELLTGGRRREASYLMAVEFIPKFMNIPGESAPFLLMAYFKYARPLKHQEPCTAEALQQVGSAVTPDAFCDAFYRSGNGTCADALSCDGYLANGASFICSEALGVCGITQNERVRLVLRLSFSLVPCICVIASIFALMTYPKTARTEASQERVVVAVAKLRRGEAVEDPWRPGSWVLPVQEVPSSHGALSYFWPRELRLLLKSPPNEEGRVDLSPLFWQLLGFAPAPLILIPVGIWIIAVGWADIADDLGASMSPLGLMVLGIGICLAWFQSVRISAMRHLARAGVSRDEVLAKYNALCPFTGSPRMEASS